MSIHRHNSGQAGGPGPATLLQHWESPHVDVEADLEPLEGEPPAVHLFMSNRAARQLLIALGMNGRRYGPEVHAVTSGLSMLLIGVMAGEENAHRPKEGTDG